jgi:hypothetical protein
VDRGETNFEDGFASPGWFLEKFPESYVAGELRDGNGNRIPGQGRLIADSTTTHVAFIGKKRVLGGWLAALGGGVRTTISERESATVAAQGAALETEAQRI